MSAGGYRGRGFGPRGVRSNGPNGGFGGPRFPHPNFNHPRPPPNRLSGPDSWLERSPRGVAFPPWQPNGNFPQRALFRGNLQFRPNNRGRAPNGRGILRFSGPGRPPLPPFPIVQGRNEIKPRPPFNNEEVHTKSHPTTEPSPAQTVLLGSEEERQQKISETADRLKQKLSSITKEEINFWEDNLTMLPPTEMEESSVPKKGILELSHDSADLDLTFNDFRDIGRVDADNSKANSLESAINVPDATIDLVDNAIKDVSTTGENVDVQQIDEDVIVIPESESNNRCVTTIDLSSDKEECQEQQTQEQLETTCNIEEPDLISSNTNISVKCTQLSALHSQDVEASVTLSQDVTQTDASQTVRSAKTDLPQDKSIQHINVSQPQLSQTNTSTNIVISSQGHQINTTVSDKVYQPKRISKPSEDLPNIQKVPNQQQQNISNQQQSVPNQPPLACSNQKPGNILETNPRYKSIPDFQPRNINMVPRYMLQMPGPRCRWPFPQTDKNSFPRGPPRFPIHNNRMPLRNVRPHMQIDLTTTVFDPRGPPPPSHRKIVPTNQESQMHTLPPFSSSNLPSSFDPSEPPPNVRPLQVSRPAAVKESTQPMPPFSPRNPLASPNVPPNKMEILPSSPAFNPRGPPPRIPNIITSSNDELKILPGFNPQQPPPRLAGSDETLQPPPVFDPRLSSQERSNLIAHPLLDNTSGVNIMPVNLMDSPQITDYSMATAFPQLPPMNIPPPPPQNLAGIQVNFPPVLSHTTSSQIIPHEFPLPPAPPICASEVQPPPLPPPPPPPPEQPADIPASLERHAINMDDGLEDMQEAMEFAKVMNMTDEIDKNVNFNMPVFPDLPPVITAPMPTEDPNPNPPQDHGTVKINEKTKIQESKEKKKLDDEPKDIPTVDKQQVNKYADVEENSLQNQESTFEDTAFTKGQIRPKVIFNLNSKSKKINKQDEWHQRSEEIKHRRQKSVVHSLGSKEIIAERRSREEKTHIDKPFDKRKNNFEKNISHQTESNSEQDCRHTEVANTNVHVSEKSESSSHKQQTPKSHSHSSNTSVPSSRIQKHSHAKKSTKKVDPPTSESSWKNRVISRFLKMSKNDIRNMINNSGPRKFDIAMKHLVKERRSSLSLEMRNTENEKIKGYDREEFMNQLNAMLDPSTVTNITSLPTEFIHYLNEVLQLDINPTDSAESLTGFDENSRPMEDMSINISCGHISECDNDEKITINVFDNEFSQEQVPQENTNQSAKIEYSKNLKVQNTKDNVQKFHNNLSSLHEPTDNSNVSANVNNIQGVIQEDIYANENQQPLFNLADLDDIFSAFTKKPRDSNLTISDEAKRAASENHSSTKSNTDHSICVDTVSQSSSQATDVDDIFSTGIIKTKSTSSKITNYENDRSHPSTSGDRCPARTETHERWCRKERDDPDAFRNLTKEEWEAKYGRSMNNRVSNLHTTKRSTSNSSDNSLNKDHHKDYRSQRFCSSESPTRHINVSPIAHANIASDTDRFSNQCNSSFEQPKEHKRERSESDTDTSSTTSSSSSSDRSDETSRDVTKLLRVIKEKEKIAKKKSLNETIRDEVTAEIERKWKEKSKHKERKSRKRDKRRRERKGKRRRERKKRKKKVPFSSSSEFEENTEVSCKLLTEDEIKKEVVVKEEPEFGSEENIQFVTDSESVLASVPTSTTCSHHASSGSTLQRGHSEKQAPISNKSTISTIVAHPKTKAQLKQMPEIHENISQKEIADKTVASSKNVLTSEDPENAENSSARQKEHTSQHRQKDKLSSAQSNTGNSVNADIPISNPVINTTPSAKSISKRTTSDLSATNQQCLSTEKLKGVSTFDEKTTVCNRELTSTTEASTESMAGKSTSKKIDIKVYKERALQRRMKEQEKLKEYMKNPSSLTQDLLHVSTSSKLHTGYNASPDAAKAKLTDAETTEHQVEDTQLSSKDQQSEKVKETSNHETSNQQETVICTDEGQIHSKNTDPSESKCQSMDKVPQVECTDTDSVATSSKLSNVDTETSPVSVDSNVKMTSSSYNKSGSTLKQEKSSEHVESTESSKKKSHEKSHVDSKKTTSTHSTSANDAYKFKNIRSEGSKELKLKKAKVNKKTHKKSVSDVHTVLKLPKSSTEKFSKATSKSDNKKETIDNVDERKDEESAQYEKETDSEELEGNIPKTRQTKTDKSHKSNEDLSVQEGLTATKSVEPVLRNLHILEESSSNREESHIKDDEESCSTFTSVSSNVTHNEKSQPSKNREKTKSISNVLSTEDVSTDKQITISSDIEDTNNDNRHTANAASITKHGSEESRLSTPTEEDISNKGIPSNEETEMDTKEDADSMGKLSGIDSCVILNTGDDKEITIKFNHSIQETNDNIGMTGIARDESNEGSGGAEAVKDLGNNGTSSFEHSNSPFTESVQSMIVPVSEKSSLLNVNQDEVNCAIRDEVTEDQDKWLDTCLNQQLHWQEMSNLETTSTNDRHDAHKTMMNNAIVPVDKSLEQQDQNSIDTSISNTDNLNENNGRELPILRDLHTEDKLNDKENILMDKCKLVDDEKQRSPSINTVMENASDEDEAFIVLDEYVDDMDTVNSSEKLNIYDTGLEDWANNDRNTYFSDHDVSPDRIANSIRDITSPDLDHFNILSEIPDKNDDNEIEKDKEERKSVQENKEGAWENTSDHLITSLDSNLLNSDITICSVTSPPSKLEHIISSNVELNSHVVPQKISNLDVGDSNVFEHSSQSTVNTSVQEQNVLSVSTVSKDDHQNNLNSDNTTSKDTSSTLEISKKLQVPTKAALKESTETHLVALDDVYTETNGNKIHHKPENFKEREEMNVELDKDQRNTSETIQHAKSVPNGESLVCSNISNAIKVPELSSAIEDDSAIFPSTSNAGIKKSACNNIHRNLFVELEKIKDIDNLVERKQKSSKEIDDSTDHYNPLHKKIYKRIETNLHKIKEKRRMKHKHIKKRDNFEKKIKDAMKVRPTHTIGSLSTQEGIMARMIEIDVEIHKLTTEKMKLYQLLESRLLHCTSSSDSGPSNRGTTMSESKVDDMNIRRIPSALISQLYQNVDVNSAIDTYCKGSGENVSSRSSDSKMEGFKADKHKSKYENVKRKRVPLFYSSDEEEDVQCTTFKKKKKQRSERGVRWEPTASDSNNVQETVLDKKQSESTKSILKKNHNKAQQDDILNSAINEKFTQNQPEKKRSPSTVNKRSEAKTSKEKSKSHTAQTSEVSTVDLEIQESDIRLKLDKNTSPDTNSTFVKPRNKSNKTIPNDKSEPRDLIENTSDKSDISDDDGNALNVDEVLVEENDDDENETESSNEEDKTNVKLTGISKAAGNKTPERLSIYSDESTWESFIQNSTSDTNEQKKSNTGLALLEENYKREMARSRKTKIEARKREKQKKRLEDFLKSVNVLTAEEEELPLSTLYIKKLQQKRDLLNSLEKKVELTPSNKDRRSPTLKGTANLVNPVKEEKMENLYVTQMEAQTNNNIPFKTFVESDATPSTLSPNKDQSIGNTEENIETNSPSRKDEEEAQEEEEKEEEEGKEAIHPVLESSQKLEDVEVLNTGSAKPGDGSINGDKECAVKSQDSTICSINTEAENLSNVPWQNIFSDLELCKDKKMEEQDVSQVLLRHNKINDINKNNLEDFVTNVNHITQSHKTDVPTDEVIQKDLQIQNVDVHMAEDTRQEKETGGQEVENEKQKSELTSISERSSDNQHPAEDIHQLENPNSSDVENVDTCKHIAQKDKRKSLNILTIRDHDKSINKEHLIESKISKVNCDTKDTVQENLDTKSKESSISSVNLQSDDKDIIVQGQGNDINEMSDKYKHEDSVNTKESEIPQKLNKDSEQFDETQEMYDIQPHTTISFSSPEASDARSEDSTIKKVGRRKRSNKHPPIRRSYRHTDENPKCSKLSETDVDTVSVEEDAHLHEKNTRTYSSKSPTPASSYDEETESTLSNTRKRNWHKSQIHKKQSRMRVESESSSPDQLVTNEDIIDRFGANTESTSTKQRPQTAKKRAYGGQHMKNCKVRLVDIKYKIPESNVSSNVLQKLDTSTPNLSTRVKHIHTDSTVNVLQFPSEETDNQCVQPTDSPIEVTHSQCSVSDRKSEESMNLKEQQSLQRASSSSEEICLYLEPDVNIIPTSVTMTEQIRQTPEPLLDQSHDKSEIEIVEEKKASDKNQEDEDPTECIIEEVDEEEPPRTQYTIHKGPILDIKVFGNSFLAASEDGVIYRYNQKSNRILNVYKGHKSAVTCIYVYNNNSTESKIECVYSGSLDGTLRCYNITTGAQIKNVADVGSPVQCMDEAWGVIFIGTKSGHVSRFHIKSGSIKGNSIQFSDKSVLALKATNEGPRRVLIVASRSQPITIRDAQSGLFLRKICGQKNHTVYSLMRDNNLIYCGTSSTSIPVFDFTTGEQTMQYDAGVGIVCMRLYRKLLFAGCYDGNIYIFDTKDHKLICSIPGPGNMLLSMEVVDNKIIAGSKDKRLHTWQMPKQVQILLHKPT